MNIIPTCFFTCVVRRRPNRGWLRVVEFALGVTDLGNPAQRAQSVGSGMEWDEPRQET